MRSINKIMPLLLALLFLIACGSAPEKTLTYNFKQGYGNLVISTLENAPPDVIYPDSDFRIVVKLENQGAYDLTKGKLKLLGFKDKYISLEETEKDILSLEDEDILHGKNPLNPLGDSTFITFKARSKELFPGAESDPAYFYIKADYDYKTELTQTVCINPKPYEVYDSGCKIEPKILLNGQGSPLAIAELEEIIYPGAVPQIEFRFALENKGKGKIKQVRLGQAKLADKLLNCEFKNNPGPDKRILDLKEKQEATLICTKALEEQKSYPTTLFLDLSFTYSLTGKKKITIQK